MRSAGYSSQKAVPNAVVANRHATKEEERRIQFIVYKTSFSARRFPTLEQPIESQAARVNVCLGDANRVLRGPIGGDC